VSDLEVSIQSCHQPSSIIILNGLKADCFRLWNDGLPVHKSLIRYLQNVKALFLNFQGRIWVFVNIIPLLQSVFLPLVTVAYFHIKIISLQVHIVHVSVILNFIVFRTHAAVAVFQGYHASHYKFPF
jgi:uncharacterized Tic20 family protein